MTIKSGSLLLIGAVLSSAQNYQIKTLAGFGLYGGDNGPAAQALIDPGAVAVDSSGNIFVADGANYRIRKINAAGIVTTLIGKGYGGFSGDGGAASDALMSTAQSLAVDGAGNLYFTDDDNGRIREVTLAGTVKTVAGSGACGTPSSGMTATQAPLCDVDSVAVDAQGRVYFASNNQIWTIAADGSLSLIAGAYGKTDNKGDGGPATAAQIGLPGTMMFDPSGNLYFGDWYNFVIREITTDQVIHPVLTIADSSASTISLAADSSGTVFVATGTATVLKISQGANSAVATLPAGYTADFLAVDKSGNLYSSNVYYERLFQITNGKPTIIAGAIPLGVDPLPAPGTSVHLQLNAVDIGLAVDTAGNIYFPELDRNLLTRIDKLSPDGTLTVLNTPAKLPVGVDGIKFSAGALAFSPSGALYFSAFSQVYRLEANGGVTLIAGAPGFPTNLGDNGPATAAKIDKAVGLAFDRAGNLYIADAFDSRVRKVTPQGVISTFAGTGTGEYSGDNGQAAAAGLSAPVAVAVDSAGNVYIADVFASVVRKVAPNGIITTVGNGIHGYSGDGGPATKAMLSGPAGIALDTAGNLFISDRNQAGASIVPTRDNNVIRKVDTSGIISTITGKFPGYNGEGLLSTSAAMGGPTALATDSQGNLYVAETNTERIRVLMPQTLDPGVVITSVNTAGGFPDVSQNDWIEIKGVNLAPASLGAAGMVWSSAPEFLTGKMPAQLDNVNVTVNGKPAFVYFISPGQMNVLTPLESATGELTIVVTNNGLSSLPFTVNLKTVSPSFLRFGATNYITATHVDYSLLGPGSLSVPGYTFTPAKPGEQILLYAVGFGLPATTLVNGSATQSGALPTLPVVTIGGVQAQVIFAGIISPGLTQLNVAVPPTAANGDNTVTATYGGASVPVGSAIAVLK